jgi:hypothetical protein
LQDDSLDEREREKGRIEDIFYLIVCFINASDFSSFPQIETKFRSDVIVSAICDIGSDANLINEQIYDQLIEKPIEISALPVQNVELISAFWKCTKN